MEMEPGESKRGKADRQTPGQHRGCSQIGSLPSPPRHSTPPSTRVAPDRLPPADVIRARRRRRRPGPRGIRGSAGSFSEGEEAQTNRTRRRAFPGSCREARFPAAPPPPTTGLRLDGAAEGSPRSRPGFPPSEQASRRASGAEALSAPARRACAVGRGDWL